MMYNPDKFKPLEKYSFKINWRENTDYPEDQKFEFLEGTDIQNAIKKYAESMPSLKKEEDYRKRKMIIDATIKYITDNIINYEPPEDYKYKKQW